MGTATGVAVFGALQPPMTGVTLSADKVAPQLPGTTVTFTAAGTGGVAPYSYKFLLTSNNWATYTIVQDWSTSPTWAWTAGPPNAYQVGVWARSAWDTADALEVGTAVGYVIALPITASLTASAQGPGAVTTTDALIQCPSVTCSHVYPYGSTVMLQATPAPGFVVGGWSAPACSTGVVVLTADTACAATFLPAVARAVRTRGSLSLRREWVRGRVHLQRADGRPHVGVE